MKKMILILCIVIIPVISLSGDFRKATWGMGVEKVKKFETSLSEPKEVTSDGLTILIYNGTVGGLQADIGYIFAEGKLTRGKYIFKETHSNRNSFITDYNKICDIIKEKYGNPKEDEIIWLNDLYKDDYSQYGFAISLGHLTMYQTWELDSTIISVGIYGENYEITHYTEYKSKQLNYLEQEVQKKQNEEDF